jgi:hypothetical protein
MFEELLACVEALAASTSFVISNAADCAGSAVPLRVTGGRQ